MQPPQQPKVQPQTLDPKVLAQNAADRKKKQQLKEVWWPFLELGSKDLTEAVNFLDVMKLGIEGAWEQKRNKATLNSLDMEKQLVKDAPDLKKVKFVLETLKDESVAESLRILASLKNLITDYGSKSMSKQPMSALKTYFDEEFKDI